jgi:hypothetical protein
MQRHVLQGLRSAQCAVHMLQVHHTFGVLTPIGGALEGGGGRGDSRDYPGLDFAMRGRIW